MNLTQMLQPDLKNTRFGKVYTKSNVTPKSTDVHVANPTPLDQVKNSKFSILQNSLSASPNEAENPQPDDNFYLPIAFRKGTRNAPKTIFSPLKLPLISQIFSNP